MINIDIVSMATYASLVIRQKDESQNGCVSGGKKYSFFGKFDVLCFLQTPVLRFALLSHNRPHCLNSMKSMSPKYSRTAPL